MFYQCCGCAALSDIFQIAQPLLSLPYFIFIYMQPSHFLLQPIFFSYSLINQLEPQCIYNWLLTQICSDLSLLLPKIIYFLWLGLTKNIIVK